MRRHRRPQLCCLGCTKQLEAVHSESEFQPNGGVICESSGNYGSSVFDPMGIKGEPHSLLFYICDECLVERSQHVFMYVGESDRPRPAQKFFRNRL